jgi:hypothetical protein
VFKSNEEEECPNALVEQEIERDDEDLNWLDRYLTTISPPIREYSLNQQIISLKSVDIAEIQPSTDLASDLRQCWSDSSSSCLNFTTVLEKLYHLYQERISKISPSNISLSSSHSNLLQIIRSFSFCLFFSHLHQISGNPIETSITHRRKFSSGRQSS